jgi:hypothetical protein
MTNTELMHRAMRLIAAASETMKDAGPEKRVEAVVMLATIAKVIHDDMTGMLTATGGPAVLAAQIAQLEVHVRQEIERIYTDGWVKH